MRLFAIITASVVANETLSKLKASQFLARSPRANSFMEELHSGNFERECVEETCTNDEFNEIYDDMAVSAPLWIRYADCSNYISQKLTVDQQKTQLRLCVKPRTQGMYTYAVYSGFGTIGPVSVRYGSRADRTGLQKNV